MKISVIIPTYNRAELLGRAVRSVLEQTYPVSEIIIFDDGSTDNTREVVQSLTEANSAAQERIRYFYQKNQGKSVALNNALPFAREDWIAYLDSDDMWLPEKIEAQVRAINQFQGRSGACVTDAKYISSREFVGTAFKRARMAYPEGISLLRNLTKLVEADWPGMYMQTLLVRTDLVRRTGGFDPRLKIGEDRDFLYSLSQLTDFVCVNRPLVLVDKSEERTESLARLMTVELLRIEQEQYMREKWLAASQSVDPQVRRAIKRHLHGVCDWQTTVHLRSGDIARARRSASAALKYGWSRGALVKWAIVHCSPQFGSRLSMFRFRRSARAIGTPSLPQNSSMQSEN